MVVPAVLYGMVGTGLAINVVTNVIPRCWYNFRGWFRKRRNYIVTISKSSNAAGFFKITEQISSFCKDFSQNSIVCFSNGQENAMYWTLSPNDEREFALSNGTTVYIKAVSFDGVNIEAYEISQYKSNKKCVVDFLADCFKTIPNLREGNHKELFTANATS